MPLCSIYIVCVLSLGRCVAIFQTLNYSRIITKSRTYIMCAVGWVIAITVASLPFFTGMHYTYNSSVCAMYVRMSKMFPRFSEEALHAVYFVIYILLVTLPALFMIGCCLAVVIKLRKKAFSERQLTRNRLKDESASNAAVTVLLIMIMFIICYGPFFVFSALNFLERIKWLPKDWLVKLLGMRGYCYLLLFVYFVLISFNSCLNPCIYYLRAKRFREEIAETLKYKLSSVEMPSFMRLKSYRRVNQIETETKGINTFNKSSKVISISSSVRRPLSVIKIGDDHARLTREHCL